MSRTGVECGPWPGPASVRIGVGTHEAAGATPFGFARVQPRRYSTTRLWPRQTIAAAIHVGISRFIAFCDAPAQPSLPAMSSLIVENVRLPTGGTGALAVHDGKIAAVGSRVDTPPGVPRIDGHGWLALPAAIDWHVHF